MSKVFKMPESRCEKHWGCSMKQKFPDSDAAVQIAEEAFRAGYEAGYRESTRFNASNWYAAWSEFEPSEDCKDLVR